MKEEDIDVVEDRAVIISDLIEQIIKVDELLAIHRKHDAHPVETQQILALRNDFTNALNDILTPYQLKIIAVDQAA